MKKRILHVSAGGLNPGGVGTVIFSIVQSLNESFDFSCVVFNRRSDQEEKFKKIGKLYRINCYPSHGKRNYLELICRPFKLYYGIKKICIKEKIDIIHCHNQRDEWICLMAAKHANVPTRIAHTHITNSQRKRNCIERLYKNISPYILDRVATIKLGCSQLACKQFYLDNDFHVIPNSIDVKKYYRAVNIEDDEFNFIHVGRFTYAKNQEFVLRTFANICSTFDNAHLFLVGYGGESEVAKLKKIIYENNIDKYVDLIDGEKVNTIDYYEKANYMIFPSRFEGFGIVLLEAQAMGIKCYVSENIQPEADVGLMVSLNLSIGEKEWAKTIIQDINKNDMKKCDYNKLLKYDNETIANIYKNIYNGEIN